MRKSGTSLWIRFEYRTLTSSRNIAIWISCTSTSTGRWPAAMMPICVHSSIVPKISRLSSFFSLFSPFECFDAGAGAAAFSSVSVPVSLSSSLEEAFDDAFLGARRVSGIAVGAANCARATAP